MKYDDAEYFFLNFETDSLPNEAGATHIGMYVAWNIINDMLSDEYDAEEAVQDVKSRKITGRDFVVDFLDCKLHDDDLNEEGNQFAEWYYESKYINDYCQVFRIDGDSTEEFCSIEDTWENFDKLALVLGKRFSEWKTNL
jgi:hypothetical protein